MVNYHALLEEIATLARCCGRDPGEVGLVAVSKEMPQVKLEEAYRQGCRDFAENRLPEALEKQMQLPKDIVWHWIGHLQRNKVKGVVGHFALIHSVDSLSLAQKIAETGPAKILLEVNTSGEASKQGFTPDQLRAVYADLQKLPNLHIAGLMTMAPLEGDIRGCFRALRELRDELQKVTVAPHTLHHLSMGMSNDYPLAIEEGATLLRIGTKLFSNEAHGKSTATGNEITG